MIIFDGIRTAADKELALVTQVAELCAAGKQVTIGAIVFTQDAGSKLYTRLKREAAERVGIAYVPQLFSITDPVEQIRTQIQKFNTDAEITGIIIQKPTKKIWQEALEQTKVNTLTYESADFSTWWTALTSQIDPKKDVDGLHPSTLAAIAENTWQEQGRVLPATCQAVLEIIEMAEAVVGSLPSGKIAIVGKSDLLGTPLYDVLRNQGREVVLLTRKGLEQRMLEGQRLLDAGVVVSATGVAGLITADLVQEGVVVVDVGEPRPDVDTTSIKEKAAFLTPVPGGVGPMTVVSLLENAVKLVTPAQ